MRVQASIDDRRAVIGYWIWKAITTVEELQQLHLARTCGALIRCAVEMGAICAGATLEQREMLRAYGSLVGLAFQLADDVLDAEEDAEKNEQGDGGSKLCLPFWA